MAIFWDFKEIMVLFFGEFVNDFLPKLYRLRVEESGKII